jgi:integrase
VRAADFGSIYIQRYVERRRAEGASNATVNRELAVLRRGFALAKQADPPLVTREPHIPKLPEENVREGFLEYDSYRTLLTALPDHLKCLFVVAYHVGCRSGELRSILPEQVDLDGKQIRLTGKQTKNGRPRTLPIYGDMEVWLRWQLDELKRNWPDCGWLFHCQNRRIGDHLKGWDKACEAAGLKGLLFHDLRRTAVRNMERANIPRSIAMQISGHRTESTYRRYDIVSQRDLRLAAARMESYLEQSSGEDQPELVTELVTVPDNEIRNSN